MIEMRLIYNRYTLLKTKNSDKVFQFISLPVSMRSLPATDRQAGIYFYVYQLLLLEE